MKRTLRNSIIVTLSLMLVLAFQNCSKAGIQVEDTLQASTADVGANGSADNSDDGNNNNNGDAATEVPTEKASQSFSSMSQYKALDMVWVVDNSASMTKNVTQTKNNISAFFSSLRKEMDINFTLITKEDAIGLNTSFKLSDYTSLGSQINFMVHSYNPMMVAAATTCPIVPDASDVFCNQVKSNYRYNMVYGALNGFFRSDSLKVFVFVTDDDSSSPGKSSMQYNGASGLGYVTESKQTVENDDFITVKGFKQRMASAFGSSSSFKSFGFVSLANGASCRARVSQAYMDLNSQSGGDSFDICAADWSANFDALTSRVSEYAATTYVVSDAKFVAVESVVLGGVTLVKGSDYSVNGNVVTLKTDLVQAVGNYQITINYTRKVQ